jgi:hypothetical protein
VQHIVPFGRVQADGVHIRYQCSTALSEELSVNCWNFNVCVYAYAEADNVLRV